MCGWLFANCSASEKNKKKNIFHLEYVKSLHKKVEYDRPGDRSPDVSTDV